MHANASTEPGLQAGDRPVLLRQMFRRRCNNTINSLISRSINSTRCRRKVAAIMARAIVTACALNACGRSGAPSPVAVAAPVPVVPAVVAPLPPRAALATTVAERRYDVRSSARIERDSSGHKDEQRVESQGVVTWSLQRSADGALRGSGRVDSFVVRIEGAGTAAPTPVNAPTSPTNAATPPRPSSTVAFDAILDATSVRVVTRPPLANECDRPEAGATALVRDLLLRVPTTVVSGDRWRDSTVSIICRVGIPITVRSQHEYLLERIEGSASTTTLVIKRVTNTRLEGKLGAAWRALELTGSGSETDNARVDVTTGALLLLDGQGTLTLQLTDRSRPTTPRTQRITQQLTTHAEVKR